MKNIYSSKYRLLLFFPLVFSIAMIFLAFFSPGLKAGLDIRGGTMLLVQSDNPLDAGAVETALKQRFDLEELSITSTGAGIRIQFTQSKLFALAEKNLSDAEARLSGNPELAKQQARQALAPLKDFSALPSNFASLNPGDALQAARETFDKANSAFKNQLQDTVLKTLSLNPSEARFQNREVGSSLGKAFWQNAVNVTIIALVLIIIIVFIFFREFIPSVAIVAAAVIDILAALGGMALFGIALSLSTIPALLMLIGYSVNTDILLTTRVLKKSEGDPRSRAFDSMITGLTMSTTSLMAALVMLVLSYYFQITVMFEIAAVIVFGLIGDMISTWFMNAPVLLWYAERKRGGKA